MELHPLHSHLPRLLPLPMLLARMPLQLDMCLPMELLRRLLRLDSICDTLPHNHPNHHCIRLLSLMYFFFMIFQKQIVILED